MPVDLHVHTTASDGVFSPEKAVATAAGIGLEALGIADHDSLDALAAARVAGEHFGVEIVPGVEINTDCAGTEVHVLGYYPELDDATLWRVLANLRSARLVRVEKIVGRLRALGFGVRLERVLEIAGAGAVGRPHVARAMEEEGYVRSAQEAFERYLGVGRPAYVERYRITPHEAVEIVRAARGIPVLAHPALIGVDGLVESLLPIGLLGLEVYHPEHRQDAVKKYLEMATRHGLLATGGSDSHGPDYRYIAPIGAVTVPYTVVEELKALKRQVVG